MAPPVPQKYLTQEISAHPGCAHRNKVVAQGSQKPYEESNEVRAGKGLDEFTFSPAPPSFQLRQDTRYHLIPAQGQHHATQKGKG